MFKRVRAIKSLVHDAVDFTVHLVQVGHESAARTTMRVLELVPEVAGPARVVNAIRRASTSFALGSVRFVNRLVQRLTDAGLDAAVAARLVPLAAAAPGVAVPMRSDVMGTAPWLSDAAIGALNGAVGDYLAREENELDLGLSLRRADAYFGDGRGAPADIEIPGSRVAVFVHGLGTTEWSWCWDALAYHGDAAQSFGTLLERDLGVGAIFVRYNTGRRVFENGRALSAVLEQMVATRGGGLDEIVLVGHSMGGLVARSACLEAARAGHAWVGLVKRVVCLGAPHQGAPLEKLGHFATTVLGSIDLPGTRIPAEILRRRSAGIRDLRDGTIVDDAWLAPDPDATRPESDREVPLVDGVAYHFVSATVTRDPLHPVGKLVGDVLVRVGSASSLAGGERRGEFTIETECFGGVVHHQLQNHPDVYALLKRACELP